MHAHNMINYRKRKKKQVKCKCHPMYGKTYTHVFLALLKKRFNNIFPACIKTMSFMSHSEIEI